MDGWIKLHRKILENPVVLKDSDHFALWIWLLLNAEHKSVNKLFGGRKVEIQEGQLITTQMYMAKCLNINRTKVGRILQFFKSEHQIALQTNNGNTLVTLLNWKSYQITEQQSEHQVNIGCTSDEHQMNIKRTSDEHQMNIKRTSDEHEQEYKNIRIKDNNIMFDSEKPKSSELKSANELFERLWKLYPEKKGKGQVSDKTKLRLLDVGEEEMLRAIERYKTELSKDDDWRRPQNGSTFFHSGFVDYLDANYTPSSERKRPRSAINDFEQRETDDYEWLYNNN